jgi:carboxymethylenebutenolidase
MISQNNIIGRFAMCDEDVSPGIVRDTSKMSRRAFSKLSAATAGVVAAGVGSWGVAAVPVTEKDVEVTTADGKCDAVLFYPTGGGTWPAVMIWPDIMSLRPAFRDIGKRLAGEGYVVFIPNIYYRAKKAPVVGDNFNFARDRAQLPATPALDKVDQDFTTFLAFIDSQPQTNKAKKMGVQGYCWGGPPVFHTAGNNPNRIGAAATFHGGGIVSAQPTSPHTFAAKNPGAEFLNCIAQNDDMNQPTAKDTLNKTYEDNKQAHHVEVFAANHGWCVAGSDVYNQAEADRAWALLLPMYKRKLV